MQHPFFRFIDWRSLEQKKLLIHEMELDSSIYTIRGNIVKEGWLYKRSEHLKNWKKRYFVLLDTGLFLGFKKKPSLDLSTDPLNSFSVEGCRLLLTERPKPFTFIMKYVQKTSVLKRLFSLSTETDRANWTEAIRTVSQNLNKHLKIPSLLKKPYVEDVPRKVDINDFDLIRVIGKGGYGKIILSKECITGTLCAIKFIDKDVVVKNNLFRHLRSENNILKRTKHPFLASLTYSFQTRREICFVMEYINGGQLLFHLQRAYRFNERTARFYIAEITLAVSYLHDQKIIFRDLKIENVLLDKDGHIKIVDFGLCKENINYTDKTNSFCGSSEYMAPELIKGNGYGREVDWWAAGIILYGMLCGRLPFYKRNRMALYNSILTKTITIPPIVRWEAADLIRGLLAKNPKRRLGGSVKGAKEIMRHSFFRFVDWHDLEQKKVSPPIVLQFSDELDDRYFDLLLSCEPITFDRPERDRSDDFWHQELDFADFGFQDTINYSHGDLVSLN